MKRVIPCLDVDAGRVVKGMNFVDIRDAGDPVELASLRQVNLGGVIVGKALYEGRFTVAEGQNALKGR